MSNAEYTAAARYRQQLLHPFECEKLQRGPFAGQPTGIFKMTCKGTLTVPASTWQGIVATPYYPTQILNWAPGVASGAIAAADFSAIAYSGATAVTNAFFGLRCLAGGLRATLTSSLTSAAGLTFSGLLTPGQLIVGQTYESFKQVPYLKTSHPTVPVEVLYEVDTGVNQYSATFQNLNVSSVATVLNDARFAFPVIIFSGVPAGQVVSYECHFIMEGIPTGNASGLIDFEVSDLTTYDWEKVLMTLPRSVGSRFVRQGVPAIADGKTSVASQMDVPRINSQARRSAHFGGGKSAGGSGGSTPGRSMITGAITKKVVDSLASAAGISPSVMATVESILHDEL